MMKSAFTTTCFIFTSLATNGCAERKEAELNGFFGTSFPENYWLKVPYFSQLDNRSDPQSTCNITSLTMAIHSHLKVSRGIILDPALWTPQKLYSLLNFQKPQTCQSFENAISRLSELQQKHEWNMEGDSTESGNSEFVRELILEDRPVVTQGWFTKSGHVVLVLGWEGWRQGEPAPKKWVVHDPYGKWDQQVNGTYIKNNVTGQKVGEYIRYDHKAFEAAVTDAGDPNSWYITWIKSD